MAPWFIRGVGLWTRSHATFDAYRDGTPVVAPPSVEIANPRLRRGTSAVTRMAVDVATQAAHAAGFDLSSMSAVFGSSLGELDVAIEQLDMMRTGDGIVSPARFKNSVHNTASGVLSIATKNPGFTTAIAAGDHTVPACLIEAVGCLEAGDSEVVVAVVDEPPPEPFASADAQLAFVPLAVAFALSTEAGATSMATVRALSLRDAADAPAVPDELQHNPVASALVLVDALLQRKSGWIALSSPPAQTWAIQLEPAR